MLTTTPRRTASSAVRRTRGLTDGADSGFLMRPRRSSTSVLVFDPSPRRRESAPVEASLEYGMSTPATATAINSAVTCGVESETTKPVPASRLTAPPLRPGVPINGAPAARRLARSRSIVRLDTSNRSARRSAVTGCRPDCRITSLIANSRSSRFTISANTLAPSKSRNPTNPDTRLSSASRTVLTTNRKASQ